MIAASMQLDMPSTMPGPEIQGPSSIARHCMKALAVKSGEGCECLCRCC